MSNATLDRIATAVFVIACVAVVGFVGYKQLVPATSELVNYDAGESLEAPVMRQLPDGQATLILNLRSTCDYCTMSMPQLRDLIRAATEDWPSLSIAVASSEPDDVFLAYLSEHSLVFSKRVHLEGTNTQLERMVVPSLIVVDAKGAVRHSWLGAMVPSRVSEVIDTLRGLTPGQTARQD